jgi:hypothetical protein
MADTTNPRGIQSELKQRAESAAESAKEYAGTVGEKVRNAASTVSNKADEAVSAAGGGIRSFAGTIREKAPHSGMLGRASDSVADTLESSGRYLQEEGLSGMTNDLTNLVKRNPIPAILISLGCGFLLAQLMRPRK